MHASVHVQVTHILVTNTVIAKQLADTGNTISVIVSGRNPTTGRGGVAGQTFRQRLMERQSWPGNLALLWPLYDGQISVRATGVVARYRHGVIAFGLRQPLGAGTVSILRQMSYHGVTVRYGRGILPTPSRAISAGILCKVVGEPYKCRDAGAGFSGPGACNQLPTTVGTLLSVLYPS